MYIFGMTKRAFRHAYLLLSASGRLRTETSMRFSSLQASVVFKQRSNTEISTKSLDTLIFSRVLETFHEVDSYL